MNKVVDFADYIFRDLSAPSDLSIASISFWLRGNLGTLNNLIGKDYSLDSNLEIVDGKGVYLGDDEFSIYEKLFNIYYLSRQIRNSLGIGGVEIISEVTSDGSTIRAVSRVQRAQTYVQLRKEITQELKTLVNSYKSGNFKPQQVVGDDTSSVDRHTFPIQRHRFGA